MYKSLISLRRFLSELLAAPTVEDPLGRMSPRELADLPVHHPRYDAIRKR